jgi:hypothetical protein
MQSLENWWRGRSKGESAALTIACYVLTAAVSIEIGRTLYQAIN